jgi:hypothetical protein
LDYLAVGPVIKPMFGSYAVNVGGKLCLFLSRYLESYAPEACKMIDRPDPRNGRGIRRNKTKNLCQVERPTT